MTSRPARGAEPARPVDARAAVRLAGRSEAASAEYVGMPSPIGPLLLIGDGTSLTALRLPEHGRAPRAEPSWARADPGCDGVLARAVRQLGEYFAGARTCFDLPLAAAGTPFQRQVWDALRAIPYGATASYGQIAERVGSPGASRAVGMANHRNPIAIVVPCHRVIGADGSLTGYGGGLVAKRALLDLEARRPVAG